jgi:hypothetical protein
MKQEKLMDAIGQVDDRLVEEAEQVTRLSGGQITRRTNWKRWGGLAALLVLVIGIWAGGTGLRNWSENQYSGSSSSDMAASVNEGTTADGSEIAESEEAAPEEAEPASGDTEESAEEESAAEDQSQAQGADKSQATLTEPPMLLVDGTQLALRSGSYDWTLEDGSGSAHTVIACGADVLQMEDTIDTISDWDSDQLTFTAAEGKLTSLTAVAYPGDSWDSEDAEPISLTVEGTTVYLPDGENNWILELTTTWEGEGYSGNAHYQVYVIPAEQWQSIKSK